MALFTRRVRVPEDSNIKIWPSNFENKDFISKEEKDIIRFFKSSIGKGNFVVGVNPVGGGPADKISYYFSNDMGLMTFQIISKDKDSVISALDMLKSLNSSLEERIINRLLDSKMLFTKQSDKKILKIPYHHFIVLQNINITTLKRKDKDVFREYEDVILFKDLTTLDNQNVIRDIGKIDSSFEYQLNDVEEKSIIERLSPEYSVIIPEKYDKNTIESSQAKSINKKTISLDITGKELEYKTFALDEEQVELINDISFGHRLILANPGAGKSVILLSKAFKICKLYDDAEVLVTCYNSNLAESYGFRAACSGFAQGKNLHISTFHKFILDFLKDTLGKRLRFDELDEALDLLEQAIDSGKIIFRFKAIFIDEVQIFEPRWLDLCYKLLDTTGDENVFILAGDLNQDLKNMSEKGKAVWQLSKEIPSNFRGRVKYLNKNYRNSKQICTYINSQLELMNLRMEQSGLIMPRDFELNTFGNADRQGEAVVIKCKINRMSLQKEIIQSVLEIHERHHVEYSDIAIIFPYKLQYYLNYFPLQWIKSGLDKQGIKYKIICQDGKSPKEKYVGGEGIVLTTVDSALGLDFKAVIVAGIYPLSYISDEKRNIEITSWGMLGKLSEKEKEEYINGLRKIYTACSRARDILYVISDVKEGMPIDEFINLKE